MMQGHLKWFCYCHDVEKCHYYCFPAGLLQSAVVVVVVGAVVVVDKGSHFRFLDEIGNNTVIRAVVGNNTLVVELQGLLVVGGSDFDNKILP